MRRKQKYKKEIEPDLEYNSPVVAKFVNAIMKDGAPAFARLAEALAKRAGMTIINISQFIRIKNN